MDYKNTVLNIEMGLNGNTEHDIAFLQEQIEKYKDSENPTEIIRACGRMMYDVLPANSKNEIGKLLGSETKSIQMTIDEAKFQIYQNKDITRGLELLQTVIENVGDLFKADDETVYYSFDNPLEHYIFLNLFDPKKEIHIPSFNESEIYLDYGYCLLELARYEEAEKAFTTALEWNPMSVGTMFQLAETYKRRKMFAPFLECNKNALIYAYTSKDIAQAYRNFGYYYSDIEKFDIAATLYYLSMQFENGPIAGAELYYIEQKTGKMPQMPTIDAIKETLNKIDIQLGTNPKILASVFSLAQKCLDNGEFAMSEFAFKVLYDLTDDENIKGVLAMIGEKLHPATK